MLFEQLTGHLLNSAKVRILPQLLELSQRGFLVERSIRLFVLCPHRQCKAENNSNEQEDEMYLMLHTRSLKKEKQYSGLVCKVTTFLNTTRFYLGFLLYLCTWYARKCRFCQLDILAPTRAERTILLF
jgi:hypothetical protein